MESQKRTARLAGLIYLLVIVFGITSLMVIRPGVVIPGDAAATAANLAASETLFRAGVASELLMYTGFLLLPLPLYRLLKSVNRDLALLMVLFVIVSVPIAMLNTLNDFAALSLLEDTAYNAAFTPQQVQAQILQFVTLHDLGYLIAQIFFGLWLMPLGYLAFRSGFLPRWLGLILILGGVSQFVNAFVSFLAPGYSNLLLTLLEIFSFSELLFCAWLLVKGVRSQPLPALALEAA
jgi:hypothetical protein